MFDDCQQFDQAEMKKLKTTEKRLKHEQLETFAELEEE